MTARALHQYFVHAAQHYPEYTAVVEPGAGSISYRELSELSDGVRDYLYDQGVQAGDRVGIYMRKSIDAVAAILGILKAGAAYVPVDPSAPPSRNGFILQDCGVKLIIVDERFADQLGAELVQPDSAPFFLTIEGVGGGIGLDKALKQIGSATRVAAEPVASKPDDLAYILYTSGSTGKPKGVTLTHENAVSFIDWCSDVFQPCETDRFSSHAPFHFDLSILDIYLSIKHGATLVLVPDDIGKDPHRLAPFIAEHKITSWYSAPSILSLLAQFGDLANKDYSSLRLVLFAGEVFPVKHLRALTRLLPKPRYFNLYGPTETNVCTYYELPLPIPDERTIPFPIGKVCDHLEGKIIDEHGHVQSRGEAGELCISGGNVMVGYWGLSERTAEAFLIEDGRRWYRTGDLVIQTDDGNYTYVGRRDRMVKRRGYRVELGEIEAGLYCHASIKEAAVIAVPDEEVGVRIKAFLSCRDTKHPSMIEMKRFCSEHLPFYMIPDVFIWREALPKTSTDKIDYQRLKEIL